MARGFLLTAMTLLFLFALFHIQIRQIEKQEKLTKFYSSLIKLERLERNKNLILISYRKAKNLEIWKKLVKEAYKAEIEGRKVWICVQDACASFFLS